MQEEQLKSELESFNRRLQTLEKSTSEILPRLKNTELRITLIENKISMFVQICENIRDDYIKNKNA